MTELAFHFGAADKLAYTCRLLRKAVAGGSRVVVVADAAAMAQLDTDLWAVSPTDFVPHCADTAARAVQGRSPVWLVTDAAHAPAGRFGVLVNLADTVPTGFAEFARVIEVVSTQDADREKARERWRFYAQRGYSIQRHDLNLKRAD